MAFAMINPGVSVSEAFAHATFAEVRKGQKKLLSELGGAGAATGGFIAAKVLRGFVKTTIEGWPGMTRKFRGISAGDLVSAVITIMGARFVDRLASPEGSRGAFEGGAYAAVLHSFAAPFLPDSLAGEYFSDSAMAGTPPRFADDELAGLGDTEYDGLGDEEYDEDMQMTW